MPPSDFDAYIDVDVRANSHANCNAAILLRLSRRYDLQFRQRPGPISDLLNLTHGARPMVIASAHGGRDTTSITQGQCSFPSWAIDSPTQNDVDELFYVDVLLDGTVLDR